MPPYKATSKQLTSGAAQTPPRTTSVSESQHIIRQQIGKEQKLEKQKKRVLKSAYQVNPEVFETEPLELHSDADREEENMFSDHSVQTKLSNAKVLTFSAGKIPIASCTISGSARRPTTHQDAKCQKALADDASDESGDSDDPDGLESTHIKAEADDLEPTYIKAEANHTNDKDDDALKKIFDGSHQRVKASDFDEISKEILGTATSIFRCLIVTQAPFPDGVAVEMRLAKEAWHEACKIKGIQVKLTPPAVKMLLLHISHVCGELKTKMRSLTSGSAFAFKDWTLKTGIYKSELLQDGINIMWFANRNDEGIVYHKYFNPIPVEVVALVLTAIECCIDEWLQGLKEDIKFTSATYASIYQAHFDSLQRFHKCTAPYKLLERLCDSLHDRARLHAGVEVLTMLSAASWIGDEAFDDGIREYQLEEHSDGEANES
ncbi:uncharacterized protein EDB91DRAFT_1084113 [Suillus paluster]|uniref:uncharacterized protein n=1 Tax=Suillus paluster TaxID=48578 RepID=UPI001B86562C|nr:uncharacterized protein EDB91DRAFT_1084113 [Suillus paluster]KAG1734203.1 hypothetical protein EDB91DRAFT_1084113 [Suillus paluster]